MRAKPSEASDAGPLQRSIAQRLGPILADPDGVPQHDTDVGSPFRLEDVDVGTENHIFLKLH